MTIFRVTAAQLRVAQGEVRCGSCSNSFNALFSLSDDLPELTDSVAEPDAVALHEAIEEPQTDSAEPAPDDEDPPVTDAKLEFNAPEEAWSSIFVADKEPVLPKVKMAQGKDDERPSDNETNQD